MNEQFTWNKFSKILLYIAGIILFFLLLNYLSLYLLPFVAAFITAYILNPITDFYTKKLKVKNRTIAVILNILTLVIAFGILYLLISPMIASEIERAVNLISTYKFTSGGGSLTIPEYFDKQIKWLLNNKVVTDLITYENLNKYWEKIFYYSWNAISGFTGFFEGIFLLITYLMYLFFIMFNYDDFSENWHKLIPSSYQESIVLLVKDIETEMRVYFRSQIKISLFLCVLFATGFKIIDLPLGILLGIFTGLLNLIPYFQVFSIPFAIILGLLSVMDSNIPFWHEVIYIVLVYVIVQIINDIILYPKIMGDATGINPALLLLSLSIWGGLLGMIGFLIAIPLTALIIKYYKHFILKEN